MKMTKCHTLPSLILQHRQVAKIKTTFVDGLLCHASGGKASTSWDQAAAATGSRLTHTEIAIGDSFDSRGMANVLRIYNDPVGVELVSRTGLNPLNSYIEVGCSKAAEERMARASAQPSGGSSSRWASRAAASRACWKRCAAATNNSSRLLT